MRFVNVVDIGRPVEDVFAYLADPENIPAWNYAIAATEKISDGPVGVGTTYRQMRTLPSRGEEQIEVTEFEPPFGLAISGALGPFTGELAYRLERTEHGTRLTNEVDLRPRGLVGMVGQLAGSRVRQAVADNLKELKKILEARSDTE